MTSILATVAETGIQPKPNHDITAGLYKLHLVADNKLIKKLVNCGQYFTNAVLDIICDRLVIENLNTQIKHALDMHKMHLEQYNRLTEAYANSSQELIARMKVDQEDLAKKMDNCLKHHDEDIYIRTHKQLELGEKTMAYVREFTTLMADCVVDIRHDLENPFTTQEAIIYKSIIVDSGNTSKKVCAEFFATLRSKIKEFNLRDL